MTPEAIESVSAEFLPKKRTLGLYGSNQIVKLWLTQGDIFRKIAGLPISGISKLQLAQLPEPNVWY